MNKLLVVFVYGLLTIATSANANLGYGHQAGSADSTVSNTDNSDRSTATSIDLGDSGGQESVSSNQTITNIKRETSEVANAVASLSLPFCGDGSAGSTKFGSFSIGGSSYSCEVSRLVAIMDEHSSNLLIRAKQHPVGSFERNQAIARAAELQTHIYKILGEDAVTYLNNRGTTSAWSTWIKDFWPLILGLVLL